MIKSKGIRKKNKRKGNKRKKRKKIILNDKEHQTFYILKHILQLETKDSFLNECAKLQESPKKFEKVMSKK